MLKVGDKVRYRPVNSEVEGPGTPVTKYLEPLDTSLVYTVREYDARFEELYGHARVLLVEVTNIDLPTMHGWMEIGYSANKFIKIG
jgi:hypothetical protein